MAANLTVLDTDLISDAIFKFRTPGVIGDTNKFAKGGFRVKFQFPPRFATDSRKCNWAESRMRGAEPIATFSTSGAREISLKWTYMAGARGGSDHDGKNILFTPSLIAKQIRALRSYFSSPNDDAITIDKALIIKFRCWKHTGSQAFSCRMNSIDITHGSALVSERKIVSMTDPGFSDNVQWQADPRRTYALRTDVVADLRLWTRVGSAGGVGFTDDDRAKEGDPKDIAKTVNEAAALNARAKIALSGVNNFVTPDWQ